MLLYALMLYGSICQPVWTLATIGLGVTALSVMTAFVGEMQERNLPASFVWPYSELFDEIKPTTPSFFLRPL